MCRDLGIVLIAEGVETADELSALRSIGIRYVQGDLIARPAVEILPPIVIDNNINRAAAA